MPKITSGLKYASYKKRGGKRLPAWVKFKPKKGKR